MQLNPALESRNHGQIMWPWLTQMAIFTSNTAARVIVYCLWHAGVQPAGEARHKRQVFRA